MKYKEDGVLHTISSGDVNEYLKDISGGQRFTTNDFRTWGASALAVKYHQTACEYVSENPRLKFETTLVKLWASFLGNTPTVCRNAYLHPAILTRACEPGFDALIHKYGVEDESYEPEELLLLRILAKT